MNKEKALPGITDSDARASIPAATAGPMTRRVAATTREGTRTSRPSLDLPRSSGTNSSDKLAPKLVKRPLTASSAWPSKSVTRQDKVSSTVPDESPTKPSGKVSKSRTSLTLRGLSTALQSKTGRPPSALPKFKAKHAADKMVEPPRSGAKKRLNDWDGEKDESKHEDKDFEDDADADFVTVERPISPLPRRASLKPSLSTSLSLSPSTPPKKRNVLHKQSNPISLTPPRPSKVPRASPASTTPISRLQTNQAPFRPASSASAHSQRVTPTQNLTRNPASRSATFSSVRSVRRRSIFSDDSVSTSSKIDASPRNPFQLPETNGASLLSPPLSPFLEGVSLDSIDAGDVSALLSTVVSPTKPGSLSQRTNRDLPPQTPLHTVPPLPNDSVARPPQTPSESSLRPLSILTTDPRQSMLSLRQFLENSGDLEHLLSQPLPAILTPDARERLLSFGFSPGFAPPPFPPGAQRPEPQTPSPIPDGQSFTSISQVLFPLSSGGEQEKPQDTQENVSLVELLKLQLASAEAQCAERDVRIQRLETQLLSAREVRNQEAAELSAQVSDLEEQLKELLEDREQENELEKRAENLESRLRNNDSEWERQLAVQVAQVRGQTIADQERLLGIERRRWAVRSATAAWECARMTAINELELMRSNKVFIEITLASLDISRQQIRQYFGGLK